MELILVGGGGHCLSCIDVIEAGQEHAIVGIVERDGIDTTTLYGYPVLGTDAQLPGLLERGDAVVVTVGQIADPEPRRALFKLLNSLSAHLITICAPDSTVSKRAKVGSGSAILSKATVNAGASVGENCIINSHALIEHGARIGDHSHISTGALVNGAVSIGEACFIGSGAVIREGVVIGAESVIGAGALIGESIPPGSRVRANWSHRL